MKLASSICTGRSLASPITSAAMAMRWSMWVATRPPPAARPLPCTMRSSPSMSAATALARKSVAVAARRSDSFTRSSLSPRITVVPSAKAAATASTGYSSIMEGAREAGTSTPCSAPARTRKSATSSPPSLRRSSRSIAAPISPSVAMRPARSGFIMTPSRITSEPGVTSAATSGNAAEDGSAGTTIGRGTSSGWPTSVMRRPCAPCGSTRKTSVRTWAPKWLSIFSVWSRVASPSITTVSPGAERPAMSAADFTCADGTGGSNTMGIGSRAPASVSGKRPSVEDSVRAPIRSSGSSTRRIGRLRKEASPSNVAVTGQPATAPSMSRQPVPELPKSSTVAGSAKPPTPTPWTSHSPAPRRSTTAPSARSTFAVLSTSSPSSNPPMRVAPTASAPRISARCEIDLSPGTRTRPLSGPSRRAVSGAGSLCIGIKSSRRRLSRAAARRHPTHSPLRERGQSRPIAADPLLTGARRLAK